MQRMAKNFFRRFENMMGMPPTDDSKQSHKRSKGNDNNRKRRSHYGNQTQSDTDTAEAMKKVAVDVEFTEIKEFDSEDKFSDHKDVHSHVVKEEQVSDVEFTEFKDK